LRIEEENREEYNQNSAENGKQLQMKKWKKKKEYSNLKCSLVIFWKPL
jgi:hypothetical protein